MRLSERAAAAGARRSVGPRSSHTLDEIKAMLVARVDAVQARYAPASPGGWRTGHALYTLNPGRADRRPGSFWINTSGPHAGTWHDAATGQRGDLIDLIALSLGCSLSEAVREARAFLGLGHDSPEDRRRREAAWQAAEAREAERKRQAAEEAAAAGRRAQALWLGAQPLTGGDPVSAYLAARGLDLARLPRLPQALRYLPDCLHVQTGPGGTRVERHFPAMVACAVDRAGRTVALHRTYLAIDPATGRWRKAPVPSPKKVLGPFGGAAIRVWAGIGPRGGHPEPLAKVPPGSRLFLAEGIEDALACALALPEARVLAAISLGNLARVALPPAVAEVVLIADNDAGAEARKLLESAVEAHAAQGRRVRVWRNGMGGKDLNDALVALQSGGVSP